MTRYITFDQAGKQVFVDDAGRPVTYADMLTEVATNTERPVATCMDCKAQGATVAQDNWAGAHVGWACVYCAHRWQHIEPGHEPTSDIDARIAEAREVPEVDECAWMTPTSEGP